MPGNRSAPRRPDPSRPATGPRGADATALKLILEPAHGGRDLPTCGTSRCEQPPPGRGAYHGPDRDVADGGWIDGLAAHTMIQVGHLASRGHRRIAVAAPDRTDPFFTLMSEHVRAAAHELGLPGPLSLPVSGAAADAARLRDLLDAGITAVAALGDDLAIGTLAALSDLGLSSPGDLAVIGFDDTAHGALWRLAVTTVHIDARAYGRRTARMILGLPIGDARPAPARVIERATT